MNRKPKVINRLTRPPTHPGAILREDVLPALGLSVSEAARQLGVTRQTLHRIMAEKASITPEMAVRLVR
jgi:addiction module HigA family antidote